MWARLCREQHVRGSGARAWREPMSMMFRAVDMIAAAV
jgi:hypothetical protein